MRRAFLTVAVIGVAWFARRNLGGWLWPQPEDKNVMATYAGGMVTKEDLLASAESHSEAERKALANSDGLHALVQDIVAKEFSEDPNTADKGGEMEGWLALNDDALSHALAHDFTQEFFRLKAGETSRVIKLASNH